MTDDKSASAAFLRDELDRRAKELEAVKHPEAVGLNSKEALQAVVQLFRHYPTDNPKVPSDPRESKLFRDIVTSSGTHELRKAVKNDEWGELNFLKGTPGETTDSSSWRAAQVLTDELWHPDNRDNMLNMIIYGPTPSISGGSNTGTGKTDFAYLAAEGGQRAYEGDLEIASNNETDEFHTVQAWSKAEEWMQDVDGPKLLILDEAAQGLMYSDQRAGKVLSKAMRLMRKYNCHLILIAHTGKDIPRDIRRQVVYARKEEKEHVKLGNKVEEDQSGEMQILNVEHELTNLPQTTIEYESYDDEGEFEWDIEDEFGDDDTDGEDKKVKCKGHTSDSEPCGAMTDHKSGYCQYHRDQWDPNSEGEDPRFDSE